MKCLNSKCRLIHPPNWVICSKEMDCMDYDCPLPHAPERKPKCGRKIECWKVDCKFLHPNGWEPKKNQKNIDCMSKGDCWNPQCPWKHPQDWNPCLLGSECINFSCIQLHPPQRKDKCQYAIECYEKECSFLHPIGWDPSKNLLQASIKKLYENGDNEEDDEFDSDEEEEEEEEEEKEKTFKETKLQKQCFNKSANMTRTSVTTL